MARRDTTRTRTEVPLPAEKIASAAMFSSANRASIVALSVKFSFYSHCERKHVFTEPNQESGGPSS